MCSWVMLICTCFMNLGGKSAVYDWLIVISIYDRYESTVKPV